MSSASSATSVSGEVNTASSAMASDELVGEARRFAGLGAGRRRFQLVAEDRQLLVELGLGKAVRQGAAQLLLADGQRRRARSPG